MATTNIIRFANETSNIYNDTSYGAFAPGGQPLGYEPPSGLHNKIFLQSSSIAAGTAQFLADNQDENITDQLTPEQISLFFKKCLLNQPFFSTMQRLITSISLTKDDNGKAFFVSSSSVTVTLPELNSVPLGFAVVIVNQNIDDCTITAQSGENIRWLTSTSQNIVLKNTEWITITAADIYWNVVQTNKIIWQSNAGGGYGYELLPNDILKQWGTLNFTPPGTSSVYSASFSFPLTYATAPVVIPCGVSAVNPGGYNMVMAVSSATTTGATFRIDSNNTAEKLIGTKVVTYLAIGGV